MTLTPNHVTTNLPLTAREVYQILKDVALRLRVMEKTSIPSWREI
jgi:hypothetical protein